ncbi:MAG: PEBP family protein [Pseudomonadota bacterium]
MRYFLSMALLAALASAVSANDPRTLGVQNVGGAGGGAITAEIWADNWFALHVNGTLVAQDSVPYETERSFNAERITFNADLPMKVAVELRDYMENETGLEYIGTRRQQMGDGGAILQFLGEDGVLGVSSAAWRCHVAQSAPVDASCEGARDPEIGLGACAAEVDMPATDWIAPGFDDSGWQAATEYSERAVRPKDGYDAISWDSAARIIWSGDLERDNIVLCRATIG